MPSARLTIIVRLDQATTLARLEDFREERRTAIGTDVSVLLSADDGPAATKLFNDLGALAIPFEATAAIGDTHYLVAGNAPRRRLFRLGCRSGSSLARAAAPIHRLFSAQSRFLLQPFHPLHIVPHPFTVCRSQPRKV